MAGILGGRKYVFLKTFQKGSLAFVSRRLIEILMLGASADNRTR